MKTIMHTIRLKSSSVLFRPLIGSAILVFLSCVCETVSAQMKLTEVNPDQSTLHEKDPDGASGGRINGLGRATNGSLFAASEWGGVFKSTDGGHVWSRLNKHLPTATWDVRASLGDPNRIFATSFYDGRVKSLAGINVSTDGGLTWIHPRTATPPVGFCREQSRRDEPSAFGISLDPENSSNVYVGTNCGLAISNDAGTTWRYVDPTPADGADDVWDVVVHDRGIIDTCGDDGHRRSTNGGATWATAVPGGSPLPSGRCSLAVSPHEPYVLFAVAGKTIYESNDGGGTWSPEYPDLAPGGRIPFVMTNARSHPNFDLWFGDVGLSRAGCITPATPSVGGAARCPASSSWAGSFTRSAGGHDDMGKLLFDSPGQPHRDDCLQGCERTHKACISGVGTDTGEAGTRCVNDYEMCRENCNASNPDGCPMLMSSDGGVYLNKLTKSPDCQSPRWEQPLVTPHALWLFGVSGAERTGGGLRDQFLYLVNQDTGTFATSNARSKKPSWANVDCCDGFNVASTPTQVVYTSCCFESGRENIIFLRSAAMEGGDEIPNYPTSGVVPGWTSDIIDRFATNSYVLVTIDGVFVTKDITARTIVWSQLGAESSPKGACGVWAAGTESSPTFYVESGSCSGSDPDKVFKYRGTAPDRQWQEVNPPGKSPENGFGIFSVARNNPNLFYASLVGPEGVRMIRSKNGGASWANDVLLDRLMTGNGVYRYRNTRGPTNFTGFDGYAQPTLVAFDPYDSRVLVAGGADSGIFLSRDGGLRWKIVTNNAGTRVNPQVPRPHSAYFNRKRGILDIYIGTQGRGVWRLRMRQPQPRAARQ
jgi:hypothetical protein